MASNLTIMGSKEILLVAENIAHEKGILLQEVIEAMEEGLKSAAKKNTAPILISNAKSIVNLVKLNYSINYKLLKMMSKILITATISQFRMLNKKTPMLKLEILLFKNYRPSILAGLWLKWLETK